MDTPNVDFLVIGVQKCATTWLHYCMVDHPDIYIPPKKREFEYLGGDLYEKNGLSWYLNLLAGAQSHHRVGAVSAEYIFDPRSPKVIHQYFPDIKLILSLRNPIDRAISAYFWLLRRGDIPDITLDQGLQIAAQQYIEGDKCPNPHPGYHEIIHRGFYDEQINHYLQYFKLEQFLFVLYEDIKDNPINSIQKIYNFLDVNPNFRSANFDAKPKFNTYFKPFILIQRLAPKSLIMGKIMDLLNQALGLITVKPKKPTLSPETLEKLNFIYKDHIIKTQEIITKALPENQPFRTNLSEVWK